MFSQLNYSLTEDENQKIALMNLNDGKLISPYIYNVEQEYNWFSIVSHNKKHGLINLNSGKIYCCEYDYIGEMEFSPVGKYFFLSKKNKKYGIIEVDSSGFITKLANKYKFINQSDITSIFELKKGNKYGLYNIETNVMTYPIKLQKKPNMYDFGNCIRLEVKKKKYGLYHLNSKVFLEPKYDEIESINIENTVFIVRRGSETGLYDIEKEKFTIELINGNIDYEHVILENYYKVTLDNTIDTYADIRTAKPVLALDYNFTGELFSERYMPVTKGDKFGIFDFKENRLVVQAKYPDAEELMEKEKVYFK
jgi:hypothetical protein